MHSSNLSDRIYVEKTPEQYLLNYHRSQGTREDVWWDRYSKWKFRWLTSVRLRWFKRKLYNEKYPPHNSTGLMEESHSSLSLSLFWPKNLKTFFEIKKKFIVELISKASVEKGIFYLCTNCEECVYIYIYIYIYARKIMKLLHILFRKVVVMNVIW